MPPKWALGCTCNRIVRSKDHQQDDRRCLNTFRSKRIPLDAATHPGTGPRAAWLGNTREPSFDFNRDVFTRDPKVVLALRPARVRTV